VVHYHDASPWPGADGNGFYLKLTDINLDNSIAANWIASNDLLLSDNDTLEDSAILTGPNPVSEYLTIRSPYEISTISLYNITGQLVARYDPACDSYDLDMRHLASGTYILRVTARNKTYSRKIIKR